MSFVASDVQTASQRLAELTVELLDAHCDTVCLADGLQATPAWLAHIEYLKDLQRVGHRTLADLSGAGDDKPRRVLARLRLPVGQLRRH